MVQSLEPSQTWGGAVSRLKELAVWWDQGTLGCKNWDWELEVQEQVVKGELEEGGNWGSRTTCGLETKCKHRAVAGITVGRTRNMVGIKDAGTKGWAGNWCVV